MTDDIDPSSTPPDGLACCLCSATVPFDEVVVPEALPYVIHFCGHACYAAWRLDAERLEGLTPR